MNNLSKSGHVGRLTQSEAILEAIQAGFFEAFLDRSRIIDFIALDSPDTVRADVVPGNNGRWYLVIGIPHEDTSLLGREIRCRINFSYDPGDHAGFTVEFSHDHLRRLLSQPGCAGLRFFPGLSTSNGNKRAPTLIAVAVRKNGFDMEDGMGYLRSQACAQLHAAPD